MDGTNDMNAGIILIHGYGGSPGDLRPLADSLAADWGDHAVTPILLEGHGTQEPPAFAAGAFEDQLIHAMERLARAGRRVILVGHSTGGALAVRAMNRCAVVPQLLVLAATPFRIDSQYVQRWIARPGSRAMPLTDVARLAHTVNEMSRQNLRITCPLLLVHGGEDELVPAQEMASWAELARGQAVRTVIVPGASHALFAGLAGPMAADVIRRAVTDAIVPPTAPEERTMAELAEAEKGLDDHVHAWPFRARHLAACPSACRVADRPFDFSPQVATEPVFANVEITTFCNMACPACARTLGGTSSRHMSRQDFNRVLNLLPHAWRVTLVGLGEPLLHPRIVELVADATAGGRNVGLVTNGSMMDRDMARRLLTAGARRITFSLDTTDERLAADLRPGVSVNRVLENIAAFTEEAKVWASRQGPTPSVAIFCALSTANAASFERFVEDVSALGVSALMVSDLNFQENRPRTLWQSADPDAIDGIDRGVRLAFRKGLIVLSVRGLEELSLGRRYRQWLLAPPNSLWQRSVKHAYCASPWQTIPVGADGHVSLCDCQPQLRLDNLLNAPLASIWNGQLMVDHRRRMRSDRPPDACLTCPRF
jgi:MoaA/NifB/PqqE/SkfB family radical SAM enzyme/alpha-beta hydrolase superfamily lysophospholipase